MAIQLPYRVRSLGQRLLRERSVSILSGPNRGMRWSLASTGRGYGTGRFAPERMEALAALLRPGDCFWDLGAHKGYVTLVASQIVGPAGRVVAVEPAAVNLWFLRKHLAWNDRGNVRVVEAAVSDADGSERFGGRGDSLSFRLGRGDEETVVRSVTSLVEDLGLEPPTAMKMDVEGSECDVLRGAGRYLKPDLLLLISIHSRSLYHACTELLSGIGYDLYPSHGMAAKVDRAHEPWGGDHDLLAVGPERQVSPGQVWRLSLFARS